MTLVCIRETLNCVTDTNQNGTSGPVASGTNSGNPSGSNGDMSGIPDISVPMEPQLPNGVGSTADPDVTKFTTEAPADVANLPDFVDHSPLSKAPANALLADFLRRPALIDSFTWDSGFVSKHIDPWALLLNDIGIKDKINFFKFMRATLHIDVQINGTPFHFGRILVSYEPVNGYRTSIDGDFRQHSNLPHVMLDPSSNAVGKLVAPFISPALWIDLTNPTGARVGVLNYDKIVDLAVFEGGVPSPVTVQTYAWFENVELSFPTPQLAATFTQQAGKAKSKKPNGGVTRSDEYEANPNAGLISKPAAMVANIAGKLSSVPVIGTFARATEIGAGAVSQIAKLFGYSSPKDLTASHVYVQRPAQNMIVCDQADQVISMTMNSKSELSIDPSVIGMGGSEDELAIRNIAGKWTLLREVLWPRTASTGTSLTTTGVGPNAWYTLPIGTNPFEISALHYASLPFRYWHGTTEIKIQVVGSRYHRGRLRFEFVPEGGLTTTSLTTSYNHVVDISEGSEYHFKIPYVGVEGYKEVPELDDPTQVSFNAKFHVGTFRVIVQNQLVCPTDEPISLLIWIRGGDDMVYNWPDLDEASAISTVPDIVAPAKVPVKDTRKLAKQSGAVTELKDAAQGNCEVITYFDSSIHENYDLAYFGDPVRSFRQLMKRYQFNYGIAWDAGSPNNTNTYIATLPMWPVPPGFYGQGSWKTTVGANPLNVSSGTLMNYLAYVFLAKKGSMRVMVDFSATDSVDGIYSNVVVSRIFDPVGSSRINTLRTQAGTSALEQARWSKYLLTGSQPNKPNYETSGGNTIFDTNTNGQAVSIEMPFYRNYRYSTNMGEIEVGNDPFARKSEQKVKLVFTGDDTDPSTPSDVVPRAAVYYKPGEDFTMHFFHGVPKLYKTQLGGGLTDVLQAWNTDPI